ncbi:MAG: MarR family transcriptional regulator [Sedimenticola sp.]|nr:MarR family transcriptional regulator [Sedimenticola sp.]
MPYTLRDGPGFYLLRAAAQFKHAFAKELKPYEITPVQFAVLGLLWESNGLTQHEIAARLGKDRPNVTRILEKIEAKSLITRQQATNDRRATHVFLSKRGQAMKPELENTAMTFRDRAYEGLTDSERTQLNRLLTRLMENLQ